MHRKLCNEFKDALISFQKLTDITTSEVAFGIADIGNQCHPLFFIMSTSAPIPFDIILSNLKKMFFLVNPEVDRQHP